MTIKVAMMGDSDRVLLKYPGLAYSRSSRKRERTSVKLTTSELTDLEETFKSLKTDVSVERLNELVALATKIRDGKQVEVKFVDTVMPNGYLVDDLVFSKDRANINMRFKIPGEIALGSVVPDDLRGKLPDTLYLFRYHMLPIVRDGMYNVKSLPVILSDETLNKLADLVEAGRLPAGVVEFMKDDVVLLHLERLPLINRRMVNAVSAQKLFALEKH
jgi:hypothetical protein